MDRLIAGTGPGAANGRALHVLLPVRRHVHRAALAGLQITCHEDMLTAGQTASKQWQQSSMGMGVSTASFGSAGGQRQKTGLKVWAWKLTSGIFTQQTCRARDRLGMSAHLRHCAATGRSARPHSESPPEPGALSPCSTAASGPQ